jgi:glycosyltransferase involved in cell wall biosynthesis
MIKVLISINTTWNFLNFRSGLIRALVSQGYDVVVVAPPDKYINQVVALGCRHISLPMDSQGLNPIADIILFLRFFKLMLRERPNFYLAYTIKPNIYGSLAAAILGISVINNVAGLGSVFDSKGWLNWLVRQLYRVSFIKSKKIFFQNFEDRQAFISGGLVRRDVTDRLPGSGVDLALFSLSPMPIRATSPIRFLLIARMLWAKGVGDYVQAARFIRQRGANAEFFLLGSQEVENPSCITKEQMREWVDEGIVNYLGMSDNVRQEIVQADCIVLPSFYREGTPRALLEAAAIGRPIITTDNVGCRDVVDDGLSGFLCRPRDAKDLAEKMELMLALSPSARESMGLRGREKVEREFDEQIVVKKYLQTIEEFKT